MAVVDDMEQSDRSDEHFTWVEQRVKSRLDRVIPFEEKVGLVGSSGRAGQTVQGIGSVLTPGDLSEFRSPVRSRIYGALTPGGGPSLRRRRPRAREREYRCPEGYQFGGRFTDSEWSTCGRQLFDLPNLLPNLLDIARSQFRTDTSIPAARVTGRVLRGQEAPGQDVLKSRAAQIPRVGSLSKKSREDGVGVAIRSLASNPKVNSMMIRRDGFPMQPVVNTAELRQVPDNRNMEDAAFLIRAADIDSFGKDELGLLSNTGVTTLIYVMPNGSTIRMDRARPLSVGERRQLGKTVSSAEKLDNSKDPLARLNSVVEASNGAITLKTNFEDVKDPDSPIESGKNSGLPKWTDEVFKGSAKAPETPDAPEGDDDKTPSAPTEDKPGERIANLENAIEHINEGGNLGEIDPSILPEAVRRSKVYKQRKLGSGRTLFERSDGGVSFIENPSKEDFEHLSAHIASNLQQALDMPTPKVRVAGKGNKRPYFVQTPDTVLPDAEDAKVSDLSKMPPADIAGMIVSDFLLDVRDRNPSSVMAISSGNQQRTISTNNIPSGGIGLDADALKERRELDLPEYLTSDGESLGNAIRNMSEDSRQTALERVRSNIERAQAFDWDEYAETMKLDGVLSPAEERHITIVRQIFDNRLEMLQNQQERLEEIFGVGE